jgi:hypothetical protein
LEGYLVRLAVFQIISLHNTVANGHACEVSFTKKFKPSPNQYLVNRLPTVVVFFWLEDKQVVIMYSNNLASMLEQPRCDGWTI